MLELTAVTKQKINLKDYDSQRDITNRILLANASAFDLEVIEEILFSALRFSIKKLAHNMECTEEELIPLLHKLTQAGLLVIEQDQVLVDKESRKYFEFEMTRFNPDFKPDLDFVQSILRKVPIHILPIWYTLPRSSNNIFESIIEKYLLTPQLFQRYLSELHYPDPIIERIKVDLFSASDNTLYSTDIVAKYNLSQQRFEEILLFLEFHFIGYLSYRKEEDHWIEVITPFYEWHQYLRFLKATETPRIAKAEIDRTYSNDFAFLEEMKRCLTLSIDTPLSLEKLQKNALTLRALDKLVTLQLARLDHGMLYPLESTQPWLDKTWENKALFLYSHPLNLATLPGNERQIREGEKAIRRVIHGEWVLFSDFLNGVIIALGDTPPIMIQKFGKHYRYAHVSHGEKEKKWLKTILFDWLFETGMVAIGTCAGNDCFSVTPFGRFCFAE